jgi:hypothetical protein
MQSTQRKQRVHINVSGGEWEDLGHLAAITDVSRSHLARMAIHYVITHPELVMNLVEANHIKKEED